MKKWIAGTAILAAVLWIVSLPSGTLSELNFWTARRQIMFFSGFVVYVMMAWVMVLALRLPVIERWLGGLDRVYRLHKWMGIWACIFAVLHWAMGQIPKWLVQSGVLTKPAKAGAAAAGAVPEINWIKIAESTGEWISYLVAIIIVIALVKRIPYHWFRRSHKLLAATFLVLTFHAVILIPAHMWITPAGLLGAAAVAGGSIAALFSLFFAIGKPRRHQGTVKQVERFGGGLMAVSCELGGEGLRHLPGQFSFARFEGTKDPHPFSMSSSGTKTTDITFHIKALGDDTGYLLENLKEGSPVVIEGPYGDFTFKTDATAAEEIWVGGGVGVTPFLARLEYLDNNRENAGLPIRFYYCSQKNNPLLERVSALCTQTGVTLHIHDYNEHGPLTLERVLSGIEEPTRARVWFCGPAGLGNALESAWRAKGLPPKYFHREYFEMR